MNTKVMRRMIATKPLRYATRHLQAGDVFEATPRDATLLTQIGKAQAAEDSDRPQSDPEQASQQAGVVDTESLDLDALRAEATALGVHVDGRWGELRLRDEIEAAQADAQAGSSASDKE